MGSKTLIEVISASKGSGRTGITFIKGSDQETYLSYAALYDQALRGLAYLQRRGLQPGDELVFQIEDNQGFIIVFWACILGGIIPVPLAVGQNDDHKQKLFHVWPALRNPYLVTSGEELKKINAFASAKGFEEVFTPIPDKFVDLAGLLQSTEPGKVYDAQPDDIAFVQFSSGSTGHPKGVVLTHRNLIANLEAISTAAQYAEADSTLSWMPLTHDMGLIGFHLNPLFSGMNQYQIPTALFIRRPAIWLNKASAHQVTILCSPNFGYRYLLKHAHTDTAQSWNLAGVRLLYNGAEPISEQLCRSFTDALAQYGLPANCMRPVYGLAEASLAVSISKLGDPVLSVHLQRDQLNFGDRVLVKAPGDDTVSVVNVGQAVKYCSVRVADRSHAAVADEVIGSIQIKGDNVTAGYYNNAAATRSAIAADGWLDTGDVGFIKEGALYITGRAKDIIFVNGQNFYPHDLERMAEAVEGIELNKVAFTGFFNHDTQQEEIIAFVFYRGPLPDFVPLAGSLRALINRQAGVAINRVIPVKDIPRTTSGKIQRFKLLEALQSGQFAALERELNGLLEASALASAAARPDSAEAHQLTEIWKNVLQRTAVPPDGKFFELGGNSLRAAELAMAVQKAFGVELPLALLYQDLTIPELAAALKTLARQAYVPIPAAPATAPCPATAVQKGIYHQWEANPSSTAYNIPVALDMAGEVDIDRLAGCVQELIRRHDSLRMSFHRTAEPELRVHDALRIAIDYTECHRSELPGRLKALVQPFDLSTLPLLRAHLLKTGPAEHVLFLDFHHIIADGVSIYYFVEELFRLYGGGAPAPVSVPFRDYAHWEKTHVQSETVTRQAQYWAGQLQGPLPVLELPLDFPRPAVFDAAGEKIAFTLSQETTHRLQEFARANGYTLHVVLLSLYKVLLGKYTGQDELIVGIPVAGRRHADLHRVQGMLVNNLPIRSQAGGSDSFLSFIDQVKRTTAQALHNQEYPFGALVEQLTHPRDVSRNPVFDTMFVFQNMGFPGAGNVPVTLRRFLFDPGFSKFDLSLEIFEDAEPLTYCFEYATRLFKRERILDLAAHFELLIGRLLENPAVRLSDVSLLTAQEHDRYLAGFNDTPVAYPADKTVVDLFEAQAAKTPDQVALISGAQQLTYRQLNEQVTKAARRLRAKGVVAGSVVGLLLPRSGGLVVSMLAVLRAGAAYVPIDVDLPRERIHYMLTDSACRVLISEPEQQPRLADLPNTCAVVSLPELLAPGETTEAPTATAAATAAPGVPAGGDLAYILYTSGTTGWPKGVMIGHAALLNYVCWAASAYCPDGPGHFPLYTSISFDLTVTSVFTPLVTGGSIVVYGQQEQSLLLEQVVTDARINAIKLTPSHLRLLTKLQLPPATVAVRRFIVGGEQLETHLAREVYGQLGGAELYNEYGPTEATVGCMIERFDPRSQQVNVPIGRPAANTQIYLLDKFLQPVPTGVRGELYIAGAGLARGYLGKEALTAERFVANPFRPGQRMYKTGDQAQWLPEGKLEYLGRFDQQVKLNGYRIELGEIEQQLRSHPQLEEALVTVGENKHGQPGLYGYYRAAAGAGVNLEAALRNYLAGKLPYYMIPAHFVRIEAIPLTGNGKVDYAALPAAAVPVGATDDPLPHGEVETLLVKIWQDVLGEEDVSVSSSFFELGGDSIKAAQIASRLLDAGVRLGVKDILTYHTIAQVSPYAAVAGGAAAYQQGEISGEAGLLPIAEWFFNHRFENPNYYNQSVLLKLDREADTGLIGRALEKLIAHHDGLRINYDPRKRVLFYNPAHAGAPFAVETFVLDGAYGTYEQPAEAYFTALREWGEQQKAGFDVTKSRLIKAALVADAGGNRLLLITAHHLVVDGVSWRILLEDFYGIYRALQGGEPVKLPLKTASLVDWAAAFAEEAASEAEAGYWDEVERTRFTLPQDFETEAWQQAHAASVAGVLTPEDTSFLLKEAHSVYRTDVPILLNTALALTLREWTGADTFVVEHENHGRHLESVDVSRTTGWFTAMYPVRLALPGHSLGDHVKAVKEQMKQVPNHGIGYGIRQFTQKPPESVPVSVTNPLTQVRFNYLGQFGKELHNDLFTYAPGVPTGSDIGANNRLTAKLEINALVVDNALRVEVTYNTKAHKASRIRWFTDALLGNINLVLAHIRDEDNVHFTPSDFDAVTLDEDELKALFY